MNPIIYTVEGNIGSGKSTFLKNLKCSDKIHILQEPVDEWFKIKNEKEENLFELFYNDPKKYAYIFQTYIFYTRFNKLLTFAPGQLVLCERSILTDFNVFLNSLYEKNDLSKLEYDVFKCWFDMIIKMSKFELKGIIYIRASPDVCMERIKKRNRNGENIIALEYLTLLHEKHEEWINNEDNVLVIDGNREEQDLINDNELEYKIDKFLFTNTIH